MMPHGIIDISTTVRGTHSATGVYRRYARQQQHGCMHNGPLFTVICAHTVRQQPRAALSPRSTVAVKPYGTVERTIAYIRSSEPNKGLLIA